MPNSRDISRVLTEHGLEHAKSHGQTAVDNDLNKAAFLACQAGDVEGLKAAGGGCFAYFAVWKDCEWEEGGRMNDYYDVANEGSIQVGFRYGTHYIECSHIAVSDSRDASFPRPKMFLGKLNDVCICGAERNFVPLPACTDDPLPTWSEKFPGNRPSLLKLAVDHEWSEEIIRTLRDLGVQDHYEFNGFTNTYIMTVKAYDAERGALVLTTLAGEELRLPDAEEITGDELGERVRQAKDIGITVDVQILYDDSTRVAPHDIVREQLAMHVSSVVPHDSTGVAPQDIGGASG